MAIRFQLGHLDLIDILRFELTNPYDQGQWMIFTAQDRKLKRILEIGCYSGYSALAWYEGTRDTQAEIITLELSQVMIDTSRKTFNKYNVNDRVKLIEGPAAESIELLTGEFDLVFIDGNKDGYLGYVQQILDKKLLSPNGIILCDNGNAPRSGKRVR